MPKGIDLMPAVLPEEATRYAPIERESWGPPGTDQPYIVILYNCDCHSFEDVETQLQKATGCTLEKAEAYAIEVDTEGRSIVFTGDARDCDQVANVLREIRLQVETDRAA